MDGQLTLFDEVLDLPALNSLVSVSYMEQETKVEAVLGTGFDLLTKFDNVQIEGCSLISNEDRDYCEAENSKFDAAVDLILRAKEFYETKELTNGFLSTKSLVKELDEKMSSITSSFVDNIVSHFRKTYSVSIDSSKFRQYDHLVTYKDVIDDILLQMDGMNFYEKAQHEIKESIREEIYNTDRVKVKSISVSVANFLSFEPWFGKFRNNRDEKLGKLLSGIELFESGGLTKREDFSTITNDRIRDDWFKEFKFEGMNKFESLKCFMNGKVQLKFTSHEYALQFAKEYLKYT